MNQRPTSWRDLDESFPRRYEVEVVDELPGRPRERHYYLPGGSRDGGHDGFLIRVTPRESAPWTALCSLAGSGTLNGLYTWADEERLLVVSSGDAVVVRVDAPEAVEPVPVAPVTQVFPLPARGLALVAGETELVAYDRAGLLWRTPRLAWDSLKVVGVRGGFADAVGYDPGRDDFTAFRVDLATGANDGSAYDESTWHDPDTLTDSLTARLGRVVARLRAR